MWREAGAGITDFPFETLLVLETKIASSKFCGLRTLSLYFRIADQSRLNTRYDPRTVRSTA